jgi:hypothetical protein
MILVRVVVVKNIRSVVANIFCDGVNHISVPDTSQESVIRHRRSNKLS